MATKKRTAAMAAKTDKDTTSSDVITIDGAGADFFLEEIDISFANPGDFSINIGEVEETGEPRPSHYSQKPGQIECIVAIRQLCKENQNDPYTDYCRYQAFKYLWRLGLKDDILFDLRKARQFLDFAIVAIEEDRGLKD